MWIRHGPLGVWDIECRRPSLSSLKKKNSQFRVFLHRKSDAFALAITELHDNIVLGLKPIP
jgi:uncharacterized protein YlxP (DUF503 family)